MITTFQTMLTLLITAAVLLAGCHAVPDDEGTASYDQIMEHADGLASQLDTPEKALAAGYLPGSVCEPRMGVHWINPALMGPELDPDTPPALLFLPGPDGIYDVDNAEFVGIEYLVITEGMPTNDTDSVPEHFGHPMDGPMAGHFPGMPWHADLHIYLAQGMRSDESLSAHNDAVVCPEGTSIPPMQSLELNPVTVDGVLSEVRGWVNITEAPSLGQLTIEVSLRGFTTPGERAVHVHENGDCGPSVDGGGGVVPGGAAGGHFNPDGAEHGAHAGDLPNLMIGEDGTGNMTVSADLLNGPLTLEDGAEYGISGRSIVVHAGADDHVSQPAGDAGPRELCGVIGKL